MVLHFVATAQDHQEAKAEANAAPETAAMTTIGSPLSNERKTSFGSASGTRRRISPEAAAAGVNLREGGAVESVGQIRNTADLAQTLDLGT